MSRICTSWLLLAGYAFAVACSSGQGGAPGTPPTSDAAQPDESDRDASTRDGGVRDAKAARDVANEAMGSDAEVSDTSTPTDGSPPSDASVACAASTCVVDTVASLDALGAPQPTHLFVDASDVYFSYHLAGYVYRAPKTGGTATVFKLEPSGDVSFLTGDATRVFVLVDDASYYRIDELNKSSGATRKMYESGFASNIDHGNFVIDTSVLFIGAGKNAGGTVDLLVIDRANATSSQLNAAWSPGTWLAQSGTNLYWASSGKIYRAPKNGTGTPQQLAWPGSDLHGRIAADGSDVFYTMRTSLEIHKLSGTTDAALHASSVTADVWDIVVDATDVYALTTDASDVGTIYRVPRTGGSLVPFATNQERARGLAQDGTHLYWSVASVPGSSAGATVVRKAK